ncbi:hypothetical protein F2Q69_00046333 [Brassica cretica]|uniref:Acyl-coenzyme A oxidase N-terminal domain-containing protein n=1 Tax=Brassica cretica TaxID=69181 RepID=A0A8S9PWI9_BRACR|nr:hypothetical protein F2Q69_00046333 [Brassica cretica]
MLSWLLSKATTARISGRISKITTNPDPDIKFTDSTDPDPDPGTPNFPDIQIHPRPNYCIYVPVKIVKSSSSPSHFSSPSSAVISSSVQLLIETGVEANECIKIYLVSNKEEVGSPEFPCVTPVDLNDFLMEMEKYMATMLNDGGGDHLAHERNKAEFDVNEMKIVWAGSRHAFEVSNRMSRLVASDPVFDKSNRAVMTRKELFKNTLRKSAHAWKLINELSLSDEESVIFKYFMDQPGFFDLHWRMFVPAIKGQGTEEQKQKWLPLANKMQKIGCYAQTELGHGSNVQGLETTATFDPQTDQFILHMVAWWFGKVFTHAVVYARLITNGKDHGVHGFIVQLRNLDGSGRREMRWWWGWGEKKKRNAVEEDKTTSVSGSEESRTSARVEAESVVRVVSDWSSWIW